MSADQNKGDTEPKSLLRVISAAPYRALQDALAKNTFDCDPDSIWPTARQRDSLLQTMWEQRKNVRDLDADALDALSTLWIQKSKAQMRARSPRSTNCSYCAAYRATAKGTGAGAASGTVTEGRYDQ